MIRKFLFCYKNLQFKFFRLEIMLEEVLQERPEWDERGDYTPGNISVYYEGGDRSHLYKVSLTKTLASVLKGKE